MNEMDSKRTTWDSSEVQRERKEMEFIPAIPEETSS